MNKFSNQLQAWITDHQIDAQLLTFEQKVQSVEEAVNVSGYPIEKFTKSIAMMTEHQQVVIAVVPADSRASTERVRKALKLETRPRTVTPEESERYLNQQVGGNSPLNAPNAIILIDPNVLRGDWLLMGGGNNMTLTKISVPELKRVTHYTEARVRK